MRVYAAANVVNTHPYESYLKLSALLKQYCGQSYRPS